jgi:hypothetical protein
MAKPPASAATRRNGSFASLRLRRMRDAVRRANTSFQSEPSSPASCILRSFPRCASTRRARRACSMRENPGMSALESTYAECLWYCACAIESPISVSRAAHSSIRPLGVVLALGARRERVVDRERKLLHPLRLRRIDVVAPHELRHRHLAHVAVLDPAEQVVEHAVAQRRGRDLHRLEDRARRTRR